MIINMYDYLPIFSLERCPETLAHWDMDGKNSTLFLRTIKRTFGKQTDLLCHVISYLINHELLHGVIQKIMEKDRWSGTFNPEWPIEISMDDDYKRIVKILNG